MALTKIQNGMIDDGAVGVNTLSADPADANSQTLLSGTFNWIYQDSFYFDLGMISVPAGNMIALLLQTQLIDFKNASIVYNAGTII